MNPSITDEAFVLSSLKEFVKAWAFGSHANFNLESIDGQARLKFEIQLRHPGDIHHHVPPPPPPLAPRHKGPARQRKNQARAEAYRKRRLDNSQPPSTQTAASADTSIADSQVVPTPDDATIQDPTQQANSAEEVVAPATEQPVEMVEDITSPVAAAAAVVHVEPSVTEPEVVPVFALAVLENCPDEVLTEEYGNSLRRFLSSEDHLARNIAESNFKHESTRSFRNGHFTHTVSMVIYVKTSGLWESPATYIRKHLAFPNNEWDRSNGTVVKLSRIHQK